MRISLCLAMAVLPALAGCSFAQQIAESSVSYYSSDHFTLVATVPANVGFTSKAHYYPKPGQTCEVYSSGLGGYVTRQQQKSNTVEAKAEAQTASTDIPLEYHIAGCSMELGRVSYEVSASYGTGARDRDLEFAGGLTVKDFKSAPEQPSKNVIAQRGICRWLFQISTAKTKKDNIEKILSCSAADEKWKVQADYSQQKKIGGTIARDILSKNIISVTFNFSKIEEPSKANRWIKTAYGWKPCQETKYTARCVDPPIFRSFMANERECTVYPNCVEQGAINE
ncbi:hypothetical protein [Pseudomonas sp. RIT288]|uniref:hypothetical protein n=1 Tax=Pseudomonas sp. RIT288 TaxID=1470589 RepID=UPI00044A7442|nr:hypothetical protein [Pseudomonas sp. RIT288]EZP33554.1 putative lipoprotein [Pseudomonas sp. RIT288]